MMTSLCFIKKKIMKQLVMATANPNKILEIKNKIGNDYDFLSLTTIGCLEEVPETSDTIEGNALQKARYIYENYHYDCFSEDTGLEIECLNGAPGVITARYAGEDKNPNANMEKVLAEMQDKQNRKARFKTVIALIFEGQEYLFEGIVNGEITTARRGNDGFGYDPIFQPEGYNRTYAEMSISDKNTMSHRALAVKQLKTFLDNLQKKAKE
jgi:XTP/dITP diphosphohydrolase